MLRRLHQCWGSRRPLATATGETAAAASGGGVKFWHVALGVSAPIAYYLVRDRGKTAALRDASTDLISPLRREVEDVAERASLSRQQGWFDADALRCWRSECAATVESLQDALRSQSSWSAVQLGSLFDREGTGIQPWELLCLFRNSPTHDSFLYSHEIAVGLASLAKDEELELAWRAFDPDLNPLSFDSFSALLDGMVRTGHFVASCLLRQTRWIPPEWSILSGQGIAERYYSSLSRQRDEPISFAEFRSKARGLSADGDLVLWYLQRKAPAPAQS